MRKQTNYGDGDGDGDGGTSFNRLPEELWWQILSLLPVETLVVLRAVCKAFLSIISDSDFVSFHLRRFPDNAVGTQVFDVLCYALGDGDLSQGWYFEACSVNSTTPTTLASIDFPFVYSRWCFLCSLDGLVLLLYEDKVNYHDIVLLWNPSIRKHRQLCVRSSEHFGSHNFQLGYHRSANDYKVVFLGEELDYEAGVYSLKTGTWTDLTLQYNGVPSNLPDYDHVLSFDHGVVWIREESFLVFFDFQTETFHRADDVFYPADQKCEQYKYPFDSPFRSGLLMLDGGCSVGSWGVDLENQPYIWSLQTESMSWTKRYKISREVVQFGVAIRTLSFVERNGELVWKHCTSRPVPANINCTSLDVLSYDIDKQVIKTSHIEFDILEAYICRAWFC